LILLSASASGTPASGSNTLSITGAQSIIGVNIATVPLGDQFTITGETSQALHTVTGRTPTADNTTTTDITFTPALSSGTYAANASLTFIANPHDPLDTRQLQLSAFRLIPLIYSVGPDGKEGIVEGPGTGSPYVWAGDPYYSWTSTTADDGTTGNSTTLYRGSPSIAHFQSSGAPVFSTAVYDNIDNHHIETR
jgi:hypothetical protein